MKIAGVVVWYQPEQECIANIKTYINEVDRLFIVDNSSRDNTQMLNQIGAMDKIEYVPLKCNKGLAYALNYAAKKAIANNYDWILTMDQDSRFSNNIIAVYKEYIANHSCSDVALLSPQYRTERSKIVETNGNTALYWTMQSANLINLTVMKKIGLFEDKYFIDCIDYEYCLRARKKGYLIMRCNEAILNHSPAINRRIGKLNYGFASPIRIYYQTRNAFDMWKKYHNLKSLGIIAVKFGKVVLLYENKGKYLKAISSGLQDCVKDRFGEKTL